MISFLMIISPIAKGRSSNLANKLIKAGKDANLYVLAGGDQYRATTGPPNL
jgi:hypothetical protein